MSDPAPARAPSLRDRAIELGALRLALLAAVAVLAASAPFSTMGSGGPGAFDAARALLLEGGAPAPPGVGVSLGVVWTALVAPPLAVMMAFVVPLDMLMSRIYMADKRGAERARYRRILAAEALALVLLAAAWTPFFAALLSR